MNYSKKSEIGLLVDGVVGTREHLRRMLLTKGLSPVTVDDFIDKVEVIIEMSGKFGKMIQRDKDLEELNQMRLAMQDLMLKKGMKFDEFI